MRDEGGYLELTGCHRCNHRIAQHTGLKLGRLRSQDCLVSICPTVEQLDNLKSVSCAEISTWLRDWLLPEEDSSLILMIIENINMDASSCCTQVELRLKKKNSHPWMCVYSVTETVLLMSLSGIWSQTAHCQRSTIYSVNKGRGWTNWTSQRKCSKNDGSSIKWGSRGLWCNFSTNEIT